MWQALVLLAVVVIGLRTIYIRLQPKTLVSYPPGPPGKPFIGNLFDIPAPFTQPGPYAFWSGLVAKYGPMIGFSIFGERILILNDREDAEELLKKRSQTFSSRRRMIYSGKYQARDQRMLMLEYGPSLRTQRAAFADMLNPDSVLTYETLMEQEATKLVAEILAVPPAYTPEGSASLKVQLNRYVASLVFTLTYGKKLADDNNLLAVQQVLDSVLLDAAPGAHLVDTFPILDRLPDFLSPWRKEAKAKHDYESSMYIGLARSVRAEMLAGTAQECFATRLWGQHEKGVFSEETLAYIAGSAFEAALQSTSGTIMWLVMAMRKFPEAQARAQKEIDDLLLEEHGSTLELPTLEMLTRLPYCIALVKEVMRWQPVAPGAFPHCAMEDTEYKGMFIGKGTLVIANVLNIHRDPRNYVEPDAFRPERFMNGVDLSSNEVFTEGHYGFGFGRRLCPARYLGGKVVFIAAIRLLWAFDIQPVFDANGNSLPVNENHCPWTVVNEPYDFPVQLQPRSEKHAAKVEREWLDVKTAWKQAAEFK